MVCAERLRKALCLKYRHRDCFCAVADHTFILTRSSQAFQTSRNFSTPMFWGKIFVKGRVKFLPHFKQIMGIGAHRTNHED